MAIAERILLGVPFLRKYLAQAFAARAINWLRASHQSPQLTLAVLRHLRATTVFPSFALCLLNLETRLGTSQPLSQALLDLPPLPRRLALLMQLGEKTGDAGAALAQVADFSEAERIASLARFERFFVLAVYCILAAAVGLAVIGMYLPIFSMGEAVSS
jgi:type II secretory pathway component PulF